MRFILVMGLGLIKNLRAAWRKLRGKTHSDIVTEHVVSGAAWAEFCDTLKSAGAALQYPGTPQNGFDQAEGYRYLARLTRAGLEAFLEYGDPLAPQLRRICHETIKIGADNPDNYYQNCNLDGRYTYRLTGQRGSVAYLSFNTKSGHYGQGGQMPPVDERDARNMSFNPDGSFEIILSAEKPETAQNWLKLAKGYTLFMVRQTHLDRTRETIADLAIERLTGPETEAQLSPEKLTEALKSASTFVAGCPLLFAHWARNMQKHSNQLPRFSDEVSTRAGGDPNIAYYHSHWKLASDEALIIHAEPPECEFWNFQLNNYWMESLDYTRRTIHTNKHLAQYNSDGSVTIIVAHKDPGHANWIETAGHDNGTMCWRWVHAEDTPEPQTRVVKFDQLTSLLPAA